MIKDIIKKHGLVELVIISGVLVFVLTLISIKLVVNFELEIFLIQKILAGYGIFCCLILFVWMFSDLASRKNIESKSSWIMLFLFFTFLAAVLYYFAVYKKTEPSPVDTLLNSKN